MKEKCVVFVIAFAMGLTSKLSAQNRPEKHIANLKAAEAEMAAPFTEGPTITKAAYMNEPKVPFTAKDILFTTKGNTLNAIILGWPGDGKQLPLTHCLKVQRT